MTQNLRASFLFYVITIQLIMCVQEKSELFGMSQRPRSSWKEISGDYSLAAKIKQQ